MKRFIILVFALVFILSFSGCGHTEDKDNKPTNKTSETTEQLQYEVPVDWTDFIKIAGIIYNGDWRVTEVSSDKIGEKIGEISCGVPKVYTDGKGNVYDDAPADGASYLCKIGTEIFSIIDNDNAIAALVNGKYYLYTSD